MVIQNTERRCGAPGISCPSVTLKFISKTQKNLPSLRMRFGQIFSFVAEKREFEDEFCFSLFDISESELIIELIESIEARKVKERKYFQKLVYGTRILGWTTLNQYYCVAS